MNNLLRNILAVAFVLVSTIAMYAAVVKGVVNDAQGIELPQATVRLLSTKDSTFVKGVKTNNDGHFTISGVRSGKYILEASHYHPREVSLHYPH